MRRRTGAIGTLIAFAAIVPLDHPAHAQDLDCGDFTYQEDAQTFFDLDRSDPHRLDEDSGPDDGLACEALPRRGLTASTFLPEASTFLPEPSTPAPTESPSPSPTAASPTQTATPTSAPPTTSAPATTPPATTTPATTPPVTTAPATTAPATTPPPTMAPTTPATVAPTRGVQGGLGGAWDSGPSGLEVGIGATFVTGAVLAAGHVVRRRRL
ncbi:excalibur calcium-binding protein [Streptomyces sp. NPDC047860]|uniref:excalibur calcium-binding protein n=1 Tax=Streptomyces sp. NPDC047860 TaxID=3155743 RepID=UPI0033EB03A5